MLVAGAGCRGPLKPVFEQIEPALTWPADPDRARIRYVGSLSSSADLKAPRKAFQAIADLFVGAREPDELYGPRSVMTTAA